MPKGKSKGAVDADVARDVARALSRANQTLAGASTVKRMTLTAAFTSSAGGVVDISASSSDVQSSPATEWASFAARFLDYRVLKVKVSWEPAVRVNLAAIFNAQGVVARDPSGAFATAGGVLATWALESAKPVNFYKSFSHTIVASEEEHMLFNPTSAVIPASNRFKLCIIGTAATVSTAVGRVYYEWIVEFRGSQ